MPPLYLFQGAAFQVADTLTSRTYLFPRCSKREVAVAFMLFEECPSLGPLGGSTSVPSLTVHLYPYSYSHFLSSVLRS